MILTTVFAYSSKFQWQISANYSIEQKKKIYQSFSNTDCFWLVECQYIFANAYVSIVRITIKNNINT